MMKGMSKRRFLLHGLMKIILGNHCERIQLKNRGKWFSIYCHPLFDKSVKCIHEHGLTFSQKENDMIYGRNFVLPNDCYLFYKLGNKNVTDDGQVYDDIGSEFEFLKDHFPERTRANVYADENDFQVRFDYNTSAPIRIYNLEHCWNVSLHDLDINCNDGNLTIVNNKLNYVNHYEMTKISSLRLFDILCYIITETRQCCMILKNSSHCYNFDEIVENLNKGMFVDFISRDDNNIEGNYENIMLYQEKFLCTKFGKSVAMEIINYVNLVLNNDCDKVNPVLSHLMQSERCVSRNLSKLLGNWAWKRLGVDISYIREKMGGLALYRIDNKINPTIRVQKFMEGFKERMVDEPEKVYHYQNFVIEDKIKGEVLKELKSDAGIIKGIISNTVQVKKLNYENTKSSYEKCFRNCLRLNLPKYSEVVSSSNQTLDKSKNVKAVKKIINVAEAREICNKEKALTNEGNKKLSINQPVLKIVKKVSEEQHEYIKNHKLINRSKRKNGETKCYVDRKNFPTIVKEDKVLLSNYFSLLSTKYIEDCEKIQEKRKNKIDGGSNYKGNVKNQNVIPINILQRDSISIKKILKSNKVNKSLNQSFRKVKENNYKNVLYNEKRKRLKQSQEGFDVSNTEVNMKKKPYGYLSPKPHIDYGYMQKLKNLRNERKIINAKLELERIEEQKREEKKKMIERNIMESRRRKENKKLQEEIDRRETKFLDELIRFAEQDSD